MDWDKWVLERQLKGVDPFSGVNTLSTEDLTDFYNYLKNPNTMQANSLSTLINAYSKEKGYSDFDEAWKNIAKDYGFEEKLPTESGAETLQRTQDIANATQTAGTTRTAAQNAGINRTKAGLLGSAGANSAATNDTVSGVQSNISNATSTQNDWLAQQGYITGLENQAENYRKGMALNAGSAFLGGFGSGLQLGGHI